MLGVAYLQTYGRQDFTGTFTFPELITGLIGLGDGLVRQTSAAVNIPRPDVLAKLRDYYLNSNVEGPEETDLVLYGIAVLEAHIRGNWDDVEALLKDGPSILTGLVYVTHALTSSLAKSKGTDFDGILNGIRRNAVDFISMLD